MSRVWLNLGPTKYGGLATIWGPEPPPRPQRGTATERRRRIEARADVGTARRRRRLHGAVTLSSSGEISIDACSSRSSKALKLSFAELLSSLFVLNLAKMV